MAMALPTTVMDTMLRLIMHLLLFIMPRAAIGRLNRSGYQVARDPGLNSITTRAVMFG
jgi:hypothetical protein